MPTSAQIIAAYRDSDLLERITAIAAAEGIANPDQWVGMRIRQIVAADLDGDGGASNSIASVYEYAVETTPPRPGANPAAVTDDHIRTALQCVTQSEGAS